MKFNKKNRQKMILSIISKNKVSTQEELVDILKESGWTATQATISRDIKELGLSKVNIEGGKQKYVQNQGEGSLAESHLVSVFVKSVTSFAQAGNLLVIKTLPGLAPACASAVDTMNFPEAVGSIAGDDTLFVATKSTLVAGHLMVKMQEILEDLNLSED